jgi:FkbM family methyltransferase
LNVGLVVDVGANIGLYSIYALQLPTVENVISVEASPQTFEELAANVALQTRADKIRAVNIAASARHATLSFFEYAPMAGHNALVDTSFVGERPGSQKIDVKAMPLDDVVTDRDAILGIKIDVEGHEIDVLTGSGAILSQCRGFFQIEIVRSENIALVRQHMKQRGWIFLGNLKNDYYFLHRDFAERVEEMRDLMFAELHDALAQLQALSRLRRNVLRACAKVGPAAESIRKVAAFRKDPVLK